MSQSNEPFGSTSLKRCYKYHAKVQERQLQEELERIDKRSLLEAKASQHAVFLKLGTFAHARHVRDKRIDTLTRLMASDATKLKKKNSQSRKNKAMKADGHFSGGPKPNTTQELTSPGGKEEVHRKSSSSGSTVVSQVKRPDDEPEFLLQKPKRKFLRSRAFSVDLLANPSIITKRRLSAPEVVVTPAATQEASESASASGYTKFYDEGQHLSPTFSLTTEFFGTERLLTDKQITEESPSSGVTDSDNEIDNREQVEADAHTSKTPSVLTSDAPRGRRRMTSVAGSFSSALLLQKGSRKLSQTTNSPGRRRSSNLSQKVHAALQKEEFIPEKDPRFTKLLSTLKDIPDCDLASEGPLALSLAALRVRSDNARPDISHKSAFAPSS